MSHLRLLTAIAILGTGVAPLVAATPKTYKRPATVPAAKVHSTTAPVTTFPIPNDEDIDRAIKHVRQILADEYKPGSLVARRESARRLLRQGLDTHDNAAARYVLLVDAANAAAAAGDAQVASRAVDELAKSYQIDPVEMKAEKFAEAAKAAFTKDSVDALVLACVATAESAMIDERYEPAGRLLNTADSAAERGKQVGLKAKVTERKKELDALRAGSDEFARARDTLSKTPGDGAASLTVGRFLCLVKGEWDKGLPLLAASGDETLKPLAVRDLENPADPGARAQAGDGWWDFSARLTGVQRTQARRRAVYWYRQSQSQLTGLSRTTVDKHLKELQAERLRDLNLYGGLVAELFAGKNFEQKRLTRVDPNIDFEFEEKGPADGMPKDNFSIIWTGHLVVTQPGQYTLLAILNQGATLELDDTNVFTESDLSHSPKGKRFPVRLDEGIHPFRLKFFDGGGKATARLLWIPPGSGGEPEPIPPDAFCHESAELASSH